jgi:hypothetical protein
MKHRFKALGLALVACFAMSVVAASAAHANQGAFTQAEGNYPTAITGAQEGSTNYFEATDGRKVECEVAKYSGSLSSAATSLTVTPTYEKCTSSGLTSVVDMNGCTFQFTTGTNTSATDTHGSVHINCPTNAKIVITVGGVCEVDIPAQTVNGGVTFTNVANGDVTVDVDITNDIHYTDTDTPSSFFCPFTSHTVTGENGDFVSNVLVQGVNAADHSIGRDIHVK